MSTRLKQCVVTEFLNAENVTPAEIHRRSQAVYGKNTVNRTTANCWAIKYRKCEPGPCPKKFKKVPSAGKILLTVFFGPHKQFT
jgi:hypothetical protein